MTTRPTRPRRRGGILKKLLIALAILLVLLVVLVLLTPWIASKVAPGFIESAANQSLKGSVKVESLRLGWSSPTVIGPVELRDEAGKPVGRVRVEVPVGLLGAIGLATGDLSNINVGEVKLDGRLDVVRNADGTMNLTKALEPRNPPTQGGSGSGSASSSAGSSPIDRIKAKLTVTDLDVTYKDLTAPGGSPTSAIGVDNFAGSADLDYAAKAGTADVNGAFAGKVQSGSGVGAAGSGDDLKLNALVKATGLPTPGAPAGPLNPNINADIGVIGVPITLVDGLAGFGGELAASIGAKADASIKAAGTRDNATAAVTLTAPGAGADLTLAYDGAAITATRPGRIWTRSTQFIAGLQAARQPLANIARSVTLDAAPGVDIALDALRIPLPKSALDNLDPKTLDLRGTQLKLAIKADAMAGRVALDPPPPASPAAPGAAPTPAAPSAAAVAMKPFKVEPATLTITTDDLAKRIDIATATRATIDGQSAGDLEVSVMAGGLLDPQGRVRALNPGASPIPDTVDADIRLKGLATALVSPVLAGLNLPIDLREDVGPTLDVQLAAMTTGPAPAAPAAPGTTPSSTTTGLAAIPPLTLTAAVNSANVRLDAPLAVRNGMVTSTAGKPVTLNIAKAGPAARRILARQAASAPAGSSPMKLDGDVRIRATVADLAAPLDAKQFDPATIKGAAEITLEDATITRPAAAPVQGQPAPPPPGPLAISRLTARATLAPGDAGGPRLVADGKLAQSGAPFTLNADIALPGFAEQFPKPKTGSLADILGFRPTGQVSLVGVPVTRLDPALEKLLTSNPTPGNVGEQIMGLVASLLGSSADITATLKPASATENAVTASVKAPGVTADVGATLRPTEIALSRAVVSTNLQPRQLDGLLDAVMPPAAGAAPLRLAQPAALNASVDPLIVPLKPDSMAPDMTRIPRVIARASSPGYLIVNNVPVGTRPDGAPKLESLGLRNLTIAADAAGSILSGEKAAPVVAYVDADVLRVVNGTPETLTTLKLKANASQDLTKPVDATVTLAGINFAGVDAVAGKGDGLIPGLIGAKGDAWIAAKGVPDARNPDLRLEVSSETERVKLFTVKLDAKQNAVRLVEPTAITLRPDVATLNRAVFPPSQTGPGPSLDGIAAIEVKLNQFAAAVPNAEQKTGPLKPGIFALDAGISLPSVRVNTPVAGPTGGPPTMIPVVLDGVRLVAKSGEPGTVALDAVIDKVSGQGAASGDKATLSARVRQIADASGNLTTDRAIIDAQADVKGFPTVLVDALANQKGILAETLGPTATLVATASGLSAGGAGTGSLTARATSPRAEASLAGTLQNKTFIASAPLDVKLVEITPKLVESLAGALPLVGSAQKTREDEPATVKGENLRVPIDGDLRKLNGRVAVTPGVMRYTTAGFFQKVLKLGELKDTGSVGRRLEPFVVNLKDGVATYDKFTLPIGEFKFETRGTVDLVDRKIDIITYVPFFAVTDEVAGALNSGLGQLLSGVMPGAIDRATMIPIRTRGAMDNPKVEPDIQLFFKENGENLVKAPGKILEDGIGKELKKVIPGGLPIPGLPKKDGAKPPR
jgi:hypothetical protein